MKLHFETDNHAINIEEFKFDKQSIVDYGDDVNKPPQETLDENVDEIKTLVSNPKCKKKLQKSKFKCRYCEDKILSYSDLEKHMLSIHGGKKPECTICNITFLKERHLIAHMRNVHKTKLTYSCHICNKKISQKEYVKKHIETVHEGKKPFKCDLCISTFRSLSTLISHMKKSHDSTGLKKNENQFNHYKDQQDQNIDQLDQNIDQLDQNIDQFKQQKDQLDQSEYQVYQNKEQSMQSDIVREPLNQTQIDCELNDIKSLLKSDILSLNVGKKSDSTIEIHERKKSWPCTICDKSFILQSNLITHMDTQHYRVNLLGMIKQALENVNNLNETIPDLTLQAVKKQIDGVHEEKKLSNTSIKKQTKLVHEEKKLFECSICKFSSELAIDLKRHMLSNHGGQRLFNCAICDDAFEQKIKLQKHIESVHGKKVPMDSL